MLGPFNETICDKVEKKVVGLKGLKPVQDIRKNEWLPAPTTNDGLVVVPAVSPYSRRSLPVSTTSASLCDSTTKDPPTVAATIRSTGVETTGLLSQSSNNGASTAAAAENMNIHPSSEQKEKMPVATARGDLDDDDDPDHPNSNSGTTAKQEEPASFLQKQPPPPPPTVNINNKPKTVEELEDRVRRKSVMDAFYLHWLGNIAAFKVMGIYLVTFETIFTCVLTTGLTIYWYEKNNWDGGGLDFVLLVFAVITPLSSAIVMAFHRRERALITLAEFRSFSHHIFMAHCLWELERAAGGETAANANQTARQEHCDSVLAQLIGIGDELSRFLTLPTASRSRHRMTRRGRNEAARTMEVAYYLLESMTTQRMARLVVYSSRLRKMGVPSAEISRLRQYERFLSDMVQQLRMIKMYRTPQALRSFARIFTVLLPAFYSPAFAQVAKELNSLFVGISFGIITSLCLTALFESLNILEDPFTAFLVIDGIDCREELEVLHFAQLTQTRKLAFPDAAEYFSGRRAAITHLNHPNKLYIPDIHIPPIMQSGNTTNTSTVAVDDDDDDGKAPTPKDPNSAGSSAPTQVLPDSSNTAAASQQGTHTHIQTAAEMDAHAHRVDEELGEALPLNEITSNRESAFHEDRLALGGSDGEEQTACSSSPRLRHRRNVSIF